MEMIWLRSPSEKNIEKRYKMWKLFFGIQDPRKDTPSKKTHPNWKIDPYVSWMQTVFPAAWNFGKFGSCDGGSTKISSE
jgi:hypothetical protein